MQICFYTDDSASNFEPLTLTRPMDDLRIGAFTIREKWLLGLGEPHYIRQVPDYLSGLFPAGTYREHDSCLWVNSRLLPNPQIIDTIASLQPGESISVNGITGVVYLDGNSSRELFEAGKQTEQQTPAHEVSGHMLEYLWDLLAVNGEEITSDLRYFKQPNLMEQSREQFFSSRPESVFTATSAKIEPNVTLIADEGPILIDNEATIEAGAILKGPLYVGQKSVIKAAARISGGTTVGPVCKVGGEVSNTIFHSYSNKGHDGYVGNSLIGQWCNFGADTNTSNLKNNYKPVRLRNWRTKEFTPDGVQFFGTVMGDHSKTAINTMLNTGTMCGVSCNLLTSSFTPAFIPSFSWISDNGRMNYRFNKAVETMKAMMKRRNIEMSDHYLSMMRFLSESEEN